MSLTEVGTHDEAEFVIVWIEDESHPWWQRTFANGEFPGACALRVKGRPTPIVLTTSDYPSSERHKWSTSGAPAAYDVESAVLHEFGHVLGLTHCDRTDVLTCPDNTAMHPDLVPGQIRRVLTVSDSVRIRALYAANVGVGPDR